MPSLSEETNGAATTLQAGASIGIVGGGQLGQMMAIAARYQGFGIEVLDPGSPCSAAQVADCQIVAEYADADAIARLADHNDVLTYEFENVDADTLDAVRARVAIPQGTDLLRVTQHRIAEKTFINNHGIATAPWRPVHNRAELATALGELGYPAVLKTAQGGYDGHGQIVLRTPEDMERVWQDAEFPECVLEGFVDFAYEASILVSGNGSDYVTFPVVRNIHRHNILHMTVATSDVDARIAEAARDLALTLARGFALAGTLAIELFVLENGEVLVNELAPRPHNSGHYTIEACDFDQFALHVQGITGQPMPQPRLLSDAVMVNVLGQHVDRVRHAAAEHPDWHVHDYGKQERRTNRKMGHITVLTDNVERTIGELEATGCWDD